MYRRRRTAGHPRRRGAHPGPARLRRRGAARRWIEYRPRPRPGACLADLDRAARKAAHRLLATGLSPHAFAQANTIMGLEEVLDRAEGYGRGRHSANFYVAVFGDPEHDDRWGWRFDGHHLSVTMTVHGDRVCPAPVFLDDANHTHTVLRRPGSDFGGTAAGLDGDVLAAHRAEAHEPSE